MLSVVESIFKDTKSSIWLSGVSCSARVYPHVCSMSCLSSILRGATGGLRASDLFLIFLALCSSSPLASLRPTCEKAAISCHDRIVSPHIFEVAASSSAAPGGLIPKSWVCRAKSQIGGGNLTAVIRHVYSVERRRAQD